MYNVVTEAADHFYAREALLDRVMGPKRFKKSSEKIRRGRLPADGLALVCLDGQEVVGTVRLWHVNAGTAGEALLLGPLAVAQDRQGAGIGAKLMKAAIETARARGHKAILLVGDAEYYCRFGFSAEKAAGLAMPGPFERHRFQGLELVEGALNGATGVLRATGPMIEKTVRRAKAA